MNKKLSTTEKQILDNLVNISKVIYDRYNQLMDIQLNNRDTSLKYNKKYQKLIKEIRLISSFENDYYNELLKQSGYFYDYITYIEDTYLAGNYLADFDLLFDKPSLLPIRRIGIKLDHYAILYNKEQELEKHIEISYLTEVSEEMKNVIDVAINGSVEDSINDLVILSYMNKIHNYKFLYHIEDLNEKVQYKDLLQIKYGVCFLYDYLEDIAFKTSFESTDMNRLIHFNIKTTKQDPSIEKTQYDIIIEDESVAQVYLILDELLKENIRGKKREFDLYDLKLYYDNLNKDVKYDIKKDLTSYEKTEKNKDTYSLCENIIGKNYKVKVKKRSKK